MEAAAKAGGPIMVTFSRGGGQFNAGKAADNTDDAACIAGTVAGALHVRTVAELYGVPVILHTDHCNKGWLKWFDGLIEANEKYYAQVRLCVCLRVRLCSPKAHGGCIMSIGRVHQPWVTVRLVLCCGALVS